MKFDSFARRLPVFLLMVFLTAGTASADDGYGSVTGQFVLDGDVPEPTLLIKKGDTQVKDAAVCAAQDVASQTLVVDPESKGIANIFVYIYPTQARGMKIHPDLEESKEKSVVFDQKGCKFIPHAMLVRTDQTIVVKSDDNCAHNTHTNTFANPPVNFIVPANDREGFEIQAKTSERLPSKVQCDIHNWMSAWWLILDHPYAAVTDEEGRFTIEKLPAGEHEFRVWHERSGWIGAGAKRGFIVEVEPDQTADIGMVKVPLSNLSEE